MIYNGKPYIPKATTKATRNLHKGYAVPTQSAVQYI